MKFSVIIPTHNRRNLLKEAIDSVLALEYEDFEIIVVDDGSTDDTKDYLKVFDGNARVVCVRQSNRGPAAARNAGLRVAKGDWIAFTDDDCRVPAEWLRRFESEIRRSSPDFVGGTVRNVHAANLYSQTSQEMVSYFVQYLQAHGRHEFMTSNNIVYTSRSIRSAGGFDEQFARPGGEERALNFTILSSGGRSAYLPDLAVEHSHRLTLRSFLIQHASYGRGSYRLQSMVGKEKSVSLMIPLRAHAGLLMTWLRDDAARGLIKCAMYILAQVATAVGYYRQAREDRGV